MSISSDGRINAFVLQNKHNRLSSHDDEDNDSNELLCDERPVLDVKDIHLIGSHLTALDDIPNIEHCVNLTELCIHSTSMTRFDGKRLECLPMLQTLNLSSNYLVSLEGIGHLKDLLHLDVSSNGLVTLSGLSGLTSLVRLVAAFNRISNLEGLSKTTGRFQLKGSKLTYLDLRGNEIMNTESLLPLRELAALRHLVLYETPQPNATVPLVNPIAYQKHYRFYVAQLLPWLDTLDGLPLPRTLEEAEVQMRNPVTRPPLKPIPVQSQSHSVSIRNDSESAKGHKENSGGEQLDAIDKMPIETHSVTPNIDKVLAMRNSKASGTQSMEVSSTQSMEVNSSQHTRLPLQHQHLTLELGVRVLPTNTGLVQTVPVYVPQLISDIRCDKDDMREKSDRMEPSEERLLPDVDDQFKFPSTARKDNSTPSPNHSFDNLNGIDGNYLPSPRHLRNLLVGKESLTATEAAVVDRIVLQVLSSRNEDKITPNVDVSEDNVLNESIRRFFAEHILKLLEDHRVQPPKGKDDSPEELFESHSTVHQTQSSDSRDVNQTESSNAIAQLQRQLNEEREVHRQEVDALRIEHDKACNILKCGFEEERRKTTEKIDGLLKTNSESIENVRNQAQSSFESKIKQMENRHVREIEDLRNSMQSDFAKERREMKRTLDSLNGQAHDAQLRLVESEQRREKLDSSLTKVLQRLTQAEAAACTTISQLESELTNSLRAQRRAEQALAEERSIYEAQSIDVKDLKELLKVTARNEARVAAELRTAQRCLLTSERQCDSLQATVKSLTQQSKNSESLVEKMQEKIRTYETEASKLNGIESQVMRLTKLLEDKERQLEGLKTFESENKALEKKVEKLEEALNVKNIMLNDKVEAIESLKQSLSETKLKYENLKKSESEALQNLEDVSLANVELTEELRSYKKRSEDVESKFTRVSELESQIVSQSKDIKALQEALVKKQEIADLVEKEIVDMRHLFRMKEARLEKKVQSELEIKQKEIEDLTLRLTDAVQKQESLLNQLDVAIRTQKQAENRATDAIAKVIEVEAEMKDLLKENEKRKRTAMMLVKELTITSD